MNSYAYTPFGSLRKEEENVSNQYLFTSKPYDQESGLYYFGARWYDPRIGRFITRDPLLEPIVLETLPILSMDIYSFESPIFIIQDLIDAPEVLHPYLYCSNDPINWIDLFGFCREKPWYERMWEEYWQWQYEFWSDPMAVAMAMFMPGVVKTGKFGKTAEDLISGALKHSRSYHSNYANKTYKEILKLAKKGDKKAQQMKKLIEQSKRLREKRRGKY